MKSIPLKKTTLYSIMNSMYHRKLGLACIICIFPCLALAAFVCLSFDWFIVTSGSVVIGQGDDYLHVNGINYLVL